MNNDYMGTDQALTTDSLIRCEALEEFKKDTQENIMSLKTNIDKVVDVGESQYDSLQKRIDVSKTIMEWKFLGLEQSIKETENQIEQLSKHINIVFLSIISILLIILSNQLYTVFSK